MPFVKGQVKKGGIKKGQIHKKTRDWKTIGEAFKGQFSDRAMSIMENASDQNFMKYYLSLLEYFAPKLSRDGNTADEDIKNTRVIWLGPERKNVGDND